MATYNKKLKTLVVHQMLDGVTVNIADTADDNMATRALNEFKRYETMHYEDNNGTHAIPYHAVQYIEVTEEDASITKADPYGCEGGSDDTWYIMGSPVPKGSENYPIGRYKQNDDFTWSYEGEPTSVATKTDALVEIYEDKLSEIKARQSGMRCTSWSNAAIIEHDVILSLIPCEA